MAESLPKLPGPWNGYFGQIIYSYLLLWYKTEAKKYIKTCSVPIFLDLLKELNQYYIDIVGLMKADIIRFFPPVIDEDGWLMWYNPKFLSYRVDIKTHRVMPLRRQMTITVSFDGTYFTPHNNPDVIISGDVIHLDSHLDNNPYDLERGIFHEMVHAAFYNRKTRHGRSLPSSSPSKSLSKFIEAYIIEESEVRKKEKAFAKAIKDKRVEIKFSTLKTITEKIEWILKDHKIGAVERSFSSKKPVINYIESAIFSYLRQDFIGYISDTDNKFIGEAFNKTLKVENEKLFLIKESNSDPDKTIVIASDLTTPVYPFRKYGDMLFETEVFKGREREELLIEYAELLLVEKVIGHRWELFRKKYSDNESYFEIQEKIIKEHQSQIFSHLSFIYSEFNHPEIK